MISDFWPSNTYIKDHDSYHVHVKLGYRLAVQIKILYLKYSILVWLTQLTQCQTTSSSGRIGDRIVWHTTIYGIYVAIYGMATISLKFNSMSSALTFNYYFIKLAQISSSQDREHLFRELVFLKHQYNSINIVTVTRTTL